MLHVKYRNIFLYQYFVYSKLLTSRISIVKTTF